MSLDVHRHFHDELSHVKVRLLTMSGEAEAALGLVTGYFRGAVDDVLSRIIEAVLALPTIIMGLLVMVALGSAVYTLYGPVIAAESLTTVVEQFPRFALPLTGYSVHDTTSKSRA